MVAITPIQKIPEARINLKNDSENSHIFEKAKLAALVPTGLVYVTSAAMSMITLSEKLAYTSTPPDRLYSSLALTAVASVGLAAIVNLKPDDLRNVGATVKRFGQTLVDGVTDLGQRLGLVEPGKTPIEQVSQEPSQRRSFWAATAVDSLRAALAAPLVFSTMGTALLALGTVGEALTGGDVASTAMKLGVAGGVSAATYLTMKGLGKLSDGISTERSFGDAAKQAKLEDTAPANKNQRAHSSDMQLG